MKRIVTFDDTETGRQRFQMIWDGFRVGALTAKPEARTQEVMRLEMAVRQALKAISTNGQVQGDDTDVRALQRGGGSVELEQPQVKLMLEYGWACQWKPTALEAAVDALDHVDAAPSTKET
jgi:hypothetical protein